MTSTRSTSSSSGFLDSNVIDHCIFSSDESDAAIETDSNGEPQELSPLEEELREVLKLVTPSGKKEFVSVVSRPPLDEATVAKKNQVQALKEDPPIAVSMDNLPNSMKVEEDQQVVHMGSPPKTRIIPSILRCGKDGEYSIHPSLECIHKQAETLRKGWFLAHELEDEKLPAGHFVSQQTASKYPTLVGRNGAPLQIIYPRDGVKVEQPGMVNIYHYQGLVRRVNLLEREKNKLSKALNNLPLASLDDSNVAINLLEQSVLKIKKQVEDNEQLGINTNRATNLNSGRIDEVINDLTQENYRINNLDGRQGLIHSALKDLSSKVTEFKQALIYQEERFSNVRASNQDLDKKMKKALEELWSSVGDLNWKMKTLSHVYVAVPEFQRKTRKINYLDHEVTRIQQWQERNDKITLWELFLKKATKRDLYFLATILMLFLFSVVLEPAWSYFN